MSKPRRKKSGRRFIQLWTNVKRSAAYHGLSANARCTLIELLDRFSGVNNGMISMSVRELADLLRCHHATAARALRELDDAGLARPLTGGIWRGKRAAEWRLTFYLCNKTGELPQTNWPGSCVAPRPAKVAGEPHSAPLRRTGATRKPKNPMIEPIECVSGATLIDIPPPGKRLGAPPVAITRPPLPDYSELEIPACLDRRRSRA
jgi:hypothetical protein